MSRKNKEGFIVKRFFVILSALFLLCTACGIQKNNSDNDFHVSTEANFSDDVPNTTSNEVSESSLETDPLSEAIREAIVEANEGSYLPGECHGVGFKIIETFKEDDILSVYALTEYVEYGFQDNIFVNISGTNPKVFLRFHITENNNYELLFYTRLDLLTDLSEEELEELIQPLIDTGKDYLYTEQDILEIRAQADEEAAEYLRSINRTADIDVRQNHEGQLLEEIISDESLLQELFKNDELSYYPNWLGTSERIENGERYIYETAFDRERQEIIYTKLEYDTNMIVKKIVVDVQNGTITQ